MKTCELWGGGVDSYDYDDSDDYDDTDISVDPRPDYDRVLGPTPPKCEYGMIWSTFIDECVLDFQKFWG